MQINWIIAGGETGHYARFCDMRWIQNLAYQAEYHDLGLVFGKNTDKTA